MQLTRHSHFVRRVKIMAHEKVIDIFRNLRT